MILHRLMKKLEDGSFEVVGYQKLEGGRIFHCKPCADNKYLPFAEMDILTLQYDNDKEWHAGNYIDHDRVDRWTSITLADGTKVFERDRVELEKRPWTVLFNNGSWILQSEADRSNAKRYDLFRNSKHITKIVGIHGVKEAV